MELTQKGQYHDIDQTNFKPGSRIQEQRREAGHLEVTMEGSNRRTSNGNTLHGIALQNMQQAALVQPAIHRCIFNRTMPRTLK